MGLADSLEQATSESANKCGVHTAMETHPDEADTIFEFATHRLDKGNAPLARVFRENNIRVSTSTLQRHRSGECLCRRRMPERYQ